MVAVENVVKLHKELNAEMAKPSPNLTKCAEYLENLKVNFAVKQSGDVTLLCFPILRPSWGPPLAGS